MILARRSKGEQRAYLEATVSAYQYVMNLSDCPASMKTRMFHMAELSKAQLEEVKREQAKELGLPPGLETIE